MTFCAAVRRGLPDPDIDVGRALKAPRCCLMGRSASCSFVKGVESTHHAFAAMKPVAMRLVEKESKNIARCDSLQLRSM